MSEEIRRGLGLLCIASAGALIGLWLSTDDGTSRYGGPVIALSVVLAVVALVLVARGLFTGDRRGDT